MISKFSTIWQEKQIFILFWRMAPCIKLLRHGSSERGYAGTCSGEILFHGKYLYLQCYMTIFPLCGYTYALARFTTMYRAVIPLTRFFQRHFFLRTIELRSRSHTSRSFLTPSRLSHDQLIHPFLLVVIATAKNPPFLFFFSPQALSNPWKHHHSSISHL